LSEVQNARSHGQLIKTTIVLNKDRLQQNRLMQPVSVTLTPCLNHDGIIENKNFTNANVKVDPYNSLHFSSNLEQCTRESCDFVLN
jgi:hypothetical protein